jgi:hypothetical protein
MLFVYFLKLAPISLCNTAKEPTISFDALYGVVDMSTFGFKARTTLFAIGVTVAASSANAGILSYYLDTDGNGVVDADSVFVPQLLGFSGQVFAKNTLTGATTFELEQFGALDVTETDLGVQLPLVTTPIQARFAGEGDGTITGTGAEVTFTDGTIELFAGGYAPANVIATFDIIGGGIDTLEASGLPSGQGSGSSLNARATSFAPGYFLTQSGVDFTVAYPDLTGNDVIFGFAIGSITTLLTQVGIDNAVANLTAAGFGPELGPPAEDGGFATAFYARTSGDVQLKVPAPATLGLLGVSLLTMGAAARRKRA